MAALLASPPMASILLNPADDAFTPLNPMSRSMSLPSQARPRPRRGSSSKEGTPQRRIKFAPLPDPRKNVLVTEAGEELPLPDVFDEEKDTPTLVTFPPSPTAPSQPPTAPAQVLSYNLSPQPSTASLGLSVSAPSSPRALRRHSPARDANSGLAKKWLRPFRPRSRSRDRADASAPSTPATPRFDASMLGAPLSRWTSASSASSNRTALARTESREPKQAPAGARLMLNGRTYGGRRERQGPKTPYTEPEFVEWGQGGMGAVRNAQWGKLQGDDPLRGRSSARTSTDNADEDDGSGMAWLRKRRAEKEAKARAEREQAGDASASSASSTTSEKSSGDGGADTDVTAPDEGDEVTLKSEEHEVKAVNVQQHAESSSGEEEEEEDTSEKERDEEDSEADADDDEEEDDNTRKTALGAGMEKVSRHHH